MRTRTRMSPPEHELLENEFYYLNIPGQTRPVDALRQGSHAIGISYEDDVNAYKRVEPVRRKRIHMHIVRARRQK